MQAPDFTLNDQNGVSHSLSDYKGRWLVVYFYPKDDTPGCTTEACTYRDNLSEFKKNDIAIVGISADTVKSHKKFEEKYSLNFPLLADPDHTVIGKFGSWGEKSMFGRVFDGIHRNTYVVNPTGAIVKEYEDVDPEKHVGEILSFIQSSTT